MNRYLGNYYFIQIRNFSRQRPFQKQTIKDMVESYNQRWKKKITLKDFYENFNSKKIKSKKTHMKQILK